MRFTVMIVDDVELNVDILSAILGGDYDIITAYSGEEAIRKMEGSQPDMVLLDLSLPGMDGFAVQQYMKDNELLKDIIVIFVTGMTDIDSEERGLERGAVDYIRKPFNGDIIRVKVRNHLDLKAYRDNLEGLVRERTAQLQERTEQLEERTIQLAASREAIIMGMSLTAEIRDHVTGEHINRVKTMTQLLANKLMEIYPSIMTEEERDLTILFSPMHDVGKVGISDMILNKPGKLTDEEFAIIQSHTTMGGDLLRQTDELLKKSDNDLKVAIDIAECHHERYDGTGYPRKYTGEEVPMPARIVALADVYDALRSQRSYKQPYSHEETYRIITVGDGRTMPSHFDPRVLEAFESVQDEFDKLF